MQAETTPKTAKDGSTTLNQLAKKSFKIKGPLLVETFLKNGPSFRNQKLNHFSTSWPFFSAKTVAYRWLSIKDGCGDGHPLAAGWLRGPPGGRPSPPTSAELDQPKWRF
jgi:hypothetical protein